MPPDTPEQLSAAFAEALTRGDLAGACELWLEDAVIVQADGTTVRGRDSLEAALGALIEHEVEIEIHLARVLATERTAVGIGTLTMRGDGAGGEPYEQRSESVVIYARRPDGSWALAIDAPWGLPKP